MLKTRINALRSLMHVQPLWLPDHPDHCMRFAHTNRRGADVAPSSTFEAGFWTSKFGGAADALLASAACTAGRARVGPVPAAAWLLWPPLPVLVPPALRAPPPSIISRALARAAAILLVCGRGRSGMLPPPPVSAASRPLPVPPPDPASPPSPCPERVTDEGVEPIGAIRPVARATTSTSLAASSARRSSSADRREASMGDRGPADGGTGEDVDGDDDSHPPFDCF